MNLSFLSHINTESGIEEVSVLVILMRTKNLA